LTNNWTRCISEDEAKGSPHEYGYRMTDSAPFRRRMEWIGTG
jgi:hypothetical protein